MKKTSMIKIGSFFLFLSFSFLYISCSSEDKCDNVECGTGTCDDGICICVGNFTGANCEKCKNGYEGSDCTMESRTKFYGMYDIIKGNCTGDDFPLYSSMEIYEHEDSVHLVKTKLISTSSSAILDTPINNDSISISIESFSNIYINLLRKSNGNLEGTYRRISTSGDGTCEITCQKK